MQEMQERFYLDPYQKEMNVRILECNPSKEGFEVVLEDTIFYPEGGGQPSDTGTIGEAKVTFVKRSGGKIIHYTDRALEPGSEHVARLDWDKRFDNMQNHTLEHIFSGLVHRKFGFDNVGFHMDEEGITVDFNGDISPEELREIEDEVNRVIASNIKTEIFFPSAQQLAALAYRSKKELSGNVRIVEAGGCDRCACCGTHVKSSGEIGMFKILESFKHRGGTRVVFAAGDRARRNFAWRLKEIAKISALLSSKPKEISEAVEALLSERALLNQKLNERTALWLESLAAEAKPEKGVVFVSKSGLTPSDLKRFAQILSEKHPEGAVCVISSANEVKSDQKESFSYVLALILHEGV